MEQIMRLVLLIFGAMIILWILYDGLRRQKKAKKVMQKMDEKIVAEDGLSESFAVNDAPIEQEVVDHTENFVANEDDVEDDIADDIIMLMIVPQQGKTFAGDLLLQALFSHDLHYGDNQIFHYYSTDSDNLEKPLFSVASASQSGDFDLETMRENSYRGLVVFMKPDKHIHPVEIFDAMIDVAGNLTAVLDAKLLSCDQQHWSTEIAAQIRTSL